MLTKLAIRNFKRLDDVEIELGNPVIFIGPNNSGKTSALQALALWDAGLRKWLERNKERDAPKKRPGVTINRRDLLALPVPEANLLWRNLHVRDVQQSTEGQRTDNVYIDIVVEGVNGTSSWKCGLEFYYANPESFYCRPLRSGAAEGARMSIPEEAARSRIAFLPPMSGLAANETKIPDGAIGVRIGEGRTAEVLRNLCYNVYEDRDRADLWNTLIGHVRALFGVELMPPEFISERGEIVMSYREREITLDLSSGGKGLQQTILLLAYLLKFKETVLLLDEPDAHLEILRQRQIYEKLCDVAEKHSNQLVIATHSEVLLSEAADRDVVVAFVGKPHRINDRGGQVVKSLKEIGFEDYYQAEQTGWVLYLEGSSDLAALRAFAESLDHHEAIAALDSPFVKYVGADQPKIARDHFHGLKEALPGLKGIALFDRLESIPQQDLHLQILMWRKREIENYLCSREALESCARMTGEKEAAETVGPLFESAEAERRLRAMRKAIEDMEDALRKLRDDSPWSEDIKASEDFLKPLFRDYYKSLELPNLMAKKNFHELARFVPVESIDPEVREKLDAIAATAQTAKPRTS